MANFCPDCGIAVNQTDNVCPSCGANLSSGNIDRNHAASFCSNCGRVINSNSSECPNCRNLNNNAHPGQKKKINGCVVALICFAVFIFIGIVFIGLVAAMAYPDFKQARANARKRICYSNQRVLLGAVEMYNMDVDSEHSMHDLDIGILVEKRYLKQRPERPEPQCVYTSDGDLAKDGKVKCTFHGGVYDSR